MAIDIEGTYTGTGSNGNGAQSVTDVTIPAGATIAIVGIHWYDSSGDSPGSLTLDGQTITVVSELVSTTNDSVKLGWVTGFASGASKTLAYTNSAFLSAGVGFRVAFLSGTETSTPMRDQATGAGAQNGNVDFSGMSFTSGDWTILATTADTSDLSLDGGANTALVAEAVISGMYAGLAYRTDGSTIGTPSSTNSYLGAAALVVKAAGGDVTLGLSGNAATVGRGTQTPGIEVPL